jgi:hypothetical protein
MIGKHPRLSSSSQHSNLHVPIAWTSMTYEHQRRPSGRRYEAKLHHGSTSGMMMKGKINSGHDLDEYA